MKTKIAALAAGAVLVANPGEANACAACRNPTLPVVRGSEGPLPEGSLRAAASLTGTGVNVVHDAGCADLDACDEVPVQPEYLHDQDVYPVELRLIGEYGVSSLFGVELQFPLRVVTTTIHYTTPDGAPYEPLDPDVHHRDETLAGPGDPWILARFGGRVGDFWLAARPGLSLPLGKTEENPFELGDHGLRHQHIQFGTGTVDPVLVLEASTELGDVRLQAFAQGQTPLYENPHGYRAPFRFYGGSSIGANLLGDLSGAIGPEVLYESPERWDGEIRQDGNLGRTELLGAASLTLQVDATLLSLAARFPLYRHIVVGEDAVGRLSSPVILTVNVGTVFAL